MTHADRPSISPRFIVSPDWVPMPEPRRLLRGLAALFGIGFLGSVVAWQIFGALSEVAGYESVLEAELERWSLTQQLILVVLLAPVLEETIYRLPLQRQLRPGLIALSLTIGALLFTAVGSALFWIIFGLAVLVASLGLFKDWESRTAIEARWSQDARIPIWSATLVFGLVHIANFDVDWSIYAVLAAPLVVSPQLWLGLMFTIARVRYGWWAGLLLHATHNGLIWSISGLAS
ncbi:MAG: CPBP family glutamic-type intramembrane protease [Acidimicrobiales bacterium]|nr:CPBP family glutamic-type intramembrane protease [Acidimicrobiales bacterium]